MLINVQASNFKSFKSTVRLDMIPSSRVKSQAEEDDKIEINKTTSLLGSAIIFGANASGKSNIIDILRFMKLCIIDKIPVSTSRLCFRGNNKEEDSSFVARFVSNEKMYEYGFSINMFERIIKKEWASVLLPTGSVKKIFTRDSSTKTYDFNDSVIKGEDSAKLEFYLDDFTEVTTKLFVTEMNENKKIAENSSLKIFADIYSWFDEKLRIIMPDEPISNFKVYYDDKSKVNTDEIIKSYDTGIDRFSSCEVSLNDFKDESGTPMPTEIINELISRSDKNINKIIGMSIRSKNIFYNLEYNPKREQKLKISTFNTFHHGIADSFSFQDESDGTKRVLDLLDILVNNTERVFVIDELDRSLHPTLVAHFIKQFKEVKKGTKTQIIITTHQPTLMDDFLFRKDEIWFVDKNINGESSLYSLELFKERNDKVFSRSYFQGRYGALPVLQDMNYKEGI